MMNKTLAWHFVGDGLRDGSPVPPDGETLVHEGDLRMCETGLHASKRLIDALCYAPGHTICRVELCGYEEQRHDDKVVGRTRTILWRIDSTELLHKFARKCALDVIHLWDAPDVVVEYLKTGNEDIKDAAWDAAWAAGDAAGDAAWVAARAARAAAGAAGAARVAAWVAAGAARDAAGAARVAAWVAARAARDAARAAARDAVWAAQNRRLTSMVMAYKRKIDGTRE